jgi:hypothetical protein
MDKVQKTTFTDYDYILFSFRLVALNVAICRVMRKIEQISEVSRYIPLKMGGGAVLQTPDPCMVWKLKLVRMSSYLF